MHTHAAEGEGKPDCTVILICVLYITHVSAFVRYLSNYVILPLCCVADDSVTMQVR